MRIEHIALYVQNLEGAKDFFTRFFEAEANDGYENSKTGLCTYLLSFSDGARLEIMTRPALGDADKQALHTGYTHLAFSVGSEQEVDRLTSRLEQEGYRIVSGPRRTGDGCYESCIDAFEHNLVEITV